jgi:hypothetical protein
MVAAAVVEVAVGLFVAQRDSSSLAGRPDFSMILRRGFLDWREKTLTGTVVEARRRSCIAQVSVALVEA